MRAQAFVADFCHFTLLATNAKRLRMDLIENFTLITTLAVQQKNLFENRKSDTGYPVKPDTEYPVGFSSQN
jgi:hypothetical protein